MARKALKRFELRHEIIRVLDAHDRLANWRQADRGLSTPEIAALAYYGCVDNAPLLDRNERNATQRALAALYREGIAIKMGTWRGRGRRVHWHRGLARRVRS